MPKFCLSCVTKTLNKYTINMYLCSFLLCLSFSLYTDYLVTIEIDNLYVKNIALQHQARAGQGSSHPADLPGRG